MMCMYPSFVFFSSVLIKFDPPNGSLGRKAEDLFSAKWGGESHEFDTILLIQNSQQLNLFSTSKTRAHLNDFVNKVNETVVNHGVRIGVEFQILSYFVLDHMGAHTLANSFLDDVDHPSAMLMALHVADETTLKQGSVKGNKFGDWFLSFMDKTILEYYPEGDMDNYVTGQVLIGKDLQEGTEQDLANMDLGALPLTLGVLALVLKSFRLLLVPMICIGSTVIIAFAMMAPVALMTDVIAMAPAVMMSGSVAFGIDFSLFLLSRYREEMWIHHLDNEVAVMSMLETAGETILVSGVTIALCWGSLVLFPVMMLSTAGLGCALTIIVALIINLSLTPALLLSFPSFFREFRRCGCIRNAQEEEEPVDHDPYVSLEEDIAESKNELSLILSDLVHNSYWFQISDTLFNKTWKNCVWVCVVLAMILPFSSSSVSFHHSESLELFTPRGAGSTESAKAIGVIFGDGKVSPYSLIVTPPEGTPLLSNQVFAHMTELIEVLVVEPSKVVPTRVAGMSYLFGSPVMYESKTQLSLMGCVSNVVESLAEECLERHCPVHALRCLADINGCGSMLLCVHRCGEDLACLTQCTQHPDHTTMSLLGCAKDYCMPRLLSTALPSPDCLSVVAQAAQQLEVVSSPSLHLGNSTWIQITLDLDPYDAKGTQWLVDMREKLKEQSLRDGYSYHLAGGSVASHDTVEAAFHLLPYAMLLTLTLVFVVISVAFRSITLSLISVFTMCLTLILVYGTVTLVYEHDALAWTHFQGFINPVSPSKLSWMSPIMVFSVICGLSTDYNVFALSRILEYRKQGMSTQDSIRAGMANTSSIITAAGCIMGIAFSGLFFSSNPALNQVSFFLVVAVLADTFVVRVILVPCLMLICGEYTWYPRKYEVVEY